MGLPVPSLNHIVRFSSMTQGPQGLSYHYIPRTQGYCLLEAKGKGQTWSLEKAKFFTIPFHLTFFFSSYGEFFL